MSTQRPEGVQSLFDAVARWNTSTRGIAILWEVELVRYVEALEAEVAALRADLEAVAGVDLRDDVNHVLADMAHGDD